MRSKDRRSHLLDALHSGEVDVAGLAARFGVSASTVRRDLQRLSQENAIRRTYGGAILAGHEQEVTLAERQSAQGAQKRAIAQAAAAMIADGDSVILDAGSTVMALGPFLKGRTLSIVTNNLALLPLLVREPGISVTVLGGALRSNSMGTVGPLALSSLRHVSADWVFMSADGVVAGRGLCEASLDQVVLKSQMIERARHVVVLADASKLGRAGHDAWAPLPARWTLVTDSAADAAEVAALKVDGASIVSAKP